MKISIFFAAQLVSSAAALELAARENPRVVGLDIQRRNVPDPVARDLRRRQSTVQQTLDNLETLYFANATMGTPPQSFRLHIDTGSSDLWMNAANSRLCTEQGNQCGDSGTYNANDSSTYEFVNNAFNISYVDGSGAAGDYATDTFRFGGQTIRDMQFGIGYISSSPEGILGIGYTINEVQVNRFGLDEYPNLPQKLKDDGTISTNAYSLWLNDLDASTGSILFGGVDTAKYTAPLRTLPIAPEQATFAEFIIILTDMGTIAHPTSLFSGSNVPVLLDSGSSLTYLPDPVASALYTSLGARYDTRQASAFVSCDLANQSGGLAFGFSGVTIEVPWNELVITAAVSRGTPVCILGIAPAGSGTSVLGDTFLRSAYVVYDLERNAISLAQTVFNASASDVKEIANDGVPGASVVQGAVSTAAVGTQGLRMANSTQTSTGGGPMVTAGPWVVGMGLAGVVMGFNGF
ncbi:aspartic peptidase domain-containing protein [Boeremia exigua]|uniref:aspartic peptidase domain-containing protein n=1 Tax=Boeremia exigua TaxID=749465 RepID=UPI001E8D31EB|nr:aspartic peptidase domain-containing protein [Boeremia exigua]KAH6642809.1 aspartic peptidase domain-containing protein [Boeremia exigua]